MGDRAGPMYLTRLRPSFRRAHMDRDVVLVPADNTSDVSGSHQVASDSRRNDRGDMICTALIFGLPLAGCSCSATQGRLLGAEGSTEQERRRMMGLASPGRPCQIHRQSKGSIFLPPP